MALRCILWYCFTAKQPSLYMQIIANELSAQNKFTNKFWWWRKGWPPGPPAQWSGIHSS